MGSLVCLFSLLLEERIKSSLADFRDSFSLLSLTAVRFNVVADRRKRNGGSFFTGFIVFWPEISRWSNWQTVICSNLFLIDLNRFAAALGLPLISVTTDILLEEEEVPFLLGSTFNQQKHSVCATKKTNKARITRNGIKWFHISIKTSLVSVAASSQAWANIRTFSSPSPL